MTQANDNKADIEISLNGEKQSLAAGSTLASLVASLQLQPQAIAIEVNRQIVPKSQYQQSTLQQDDQIEIVTMVGGG